MSLSFYVFLGRKPRKLIATVSKKSSISTNGSMNGLARSGTYPTSMVIPLCKLQSMTCLTPAHSGKGWSIWKGSRWLVHSTSVVIWCHVLMFVYFYDTFNNIIVYLYYYVFHSLPIWQDCSTLHNILSNVFLCCIMLCHLVSHHTRPF